MPHLAKSLAINNNRHMTTDQSSVKKERRVTANDDVDGDDKPDMSTTAAPGYIGSTESTLRTWRSLKKGPAHYRGQGREILPQGGSRHLHPIPPDRAGGRKGTA